MFRQTDSIPEIRCPYCFFYISITGINSEESKLVFNCENCGKKEISLEQYNSLNQESLIKTCNCCYKNIPVKVMLYSQKNGTFICKNCYSTLLKEKKVLNDRFLNFYEIGKYCQIHKYYLNSYFCEFCERHICSQCLAQHKNSFHKIKNVCEETKNKNQIQEMISIIKKEEGEIESEEKLGLIILNSMKQIFENDYNNRKNVFDLKKVLYSYFVSSSNNYSAYLNIENIFNKEKNPDFFINDSELNELTELLNNICNKSNINDKENNIKNSQKNKNNDNNEKNRNKSSTSSKNRKHYEKHSSTIIKQSKRNSQISSKLSKMINQNTSNSDKNKYNNNNKNNYKKETYKEYRRKKNLYALVTPIKTQRMKNRKYNKYSNEAINKEIQNNNSQFLCSSMNIILSRSHNRNENLGLIQRLDDSIINMLILEENIILISVFSPNKNLILSQIIKERKGDNNVIIMKIFNTIKIGHKPIIYMEKCENEKILSCSDEKVNIFKIVNNKIHIQNIFAVNHIITCKSIEKDNFLILKTNTHDNIHEIIYYNNINDSISSKYIKIVKPIPKEFKAISLEKISNVTCALIMQKINEININKNVIYLRLLNLINNQLTFSTEKEFVCKDQEKMDKILIKKLFDNYLMISESSSSFNIYDFKKDAVVFNFQCENIISTYIKEIDNEQIYFYTLENKEIEGKYLMEEIKIKKYLIKKTKGENGNNTNKNKEIEIDALNFSKLYGYNKNKKFNVMIAINDNGIDECQNGINKNLILLADNMGNIFYKYY